MQAGTAIMILMVVTSHGQMDDGTATGLWLDEFAAPYEIFLDAGFEVTVASPLGGKTPIDPRSMTEEARLANVEEALKALEDARRLDEVDFKGYDAVFFPGGHGTMFDFPTSAAVRKAVEHFVGGGAPSAFVCHGPAALVGAEDDAGQPLVKGRTVTGFTNEEERKVGLTEEVPFLLETRLSELGGQFVGGKAFGEHVIVDGNLVTGQNPASSAKAARELIELLKREK